MDRPGTQASHSLNSIEPVSTFISSFTTNHSLQYTKTFRLLLFLDLSELSCQYLELRETLIDGNFALFHLSRQSFQLRRDLSSILNEERVKR